MFEKYCDYCGKRIEKEDYMVHIRYTKFDGTHNEYYHLRCYEEMQKKILETANIKRKYVKKVGR